MAYGSLRLMLCLHDAIVAATCRATAFPLNVTFQYEFLSIKTYSVSNFSRMGNGNAPRPSEHANACWHLKFKTDVTPATLSHDYVAQLYRATKSLCATLCTL